MLAGCTLALADRFPPYLDAVFTRQDGADDRVFRLAHTLVSDINPACELRMVALRSHSTLEEDGSIGLGNADIFKAVFVDPGASGIIGSDDIEVTLLLQIETNGEISRGRLTHVPQGMASALNGSSDDVFVRGRAWLMYRDSEVVIGQVDAEFRAHRIGASFRVIPISK